MATKGYFPKRPDTKPTIYAYELIGVPDHKGQLKIGYTTRNVKTRIKEQLGTSTVKYRIVYEESSLLDNGNAFTDHEVHRILRKRGIENPEGEWFKCTIQQIESVVQEIRTGEYSDDARVHNFPMRPEQQGAVEKTIQYFEEIQRENKNRKNGSRTPSFLWNAKMRFGKTFASYQLAKKMKWTRMLVVTFKPAVEDAWREDLLTHVDFKNWQYHYAKDRETSPEELEEILAKNREKSQPLVCFGSFQDLLGVDKKTGAIKAKNKWIHAINWDVVIFDEYHFGAWRDRSKGIFFDDDYEAEEEFQAYEEQEKEGLSEESKASYMQDILPITTNHFLYLSGTPFRALSSGEFIEEQIFSWTYSDEQKAKREWPASKPNPYASLPRMVLLTYRLPDHVINIASQGEFDSFDLNAFFKAEGEGKSAIFRHQNEVQKWLDFIRGALNTSDTSALKQRKGKAYLPFSETVLLNVLNHTLWFLPSVAACDAMKNLLTQKQNKFYHDYEIVVAAGKKAGSGVKALGPVLKAISNDPFKKKTITLSCGKLTTGVSVKPWTGIFMLRNSSSPETYFQAAFRVQTPWAIKNPDGLSPNQEEVIKQECYVFDFAPNRALKQIADYACRLKSFGESPQKSVEEFIDFLPVLAYEGGIMGPISAAGILDIAMSGTTATLLARRWESALLVNVDNTTLEKLLNNEKAMQALMSIEGFRNLNQDIQAVINVSEKIKETKKDASERDLTPRENKELSEDEKEYKKRRKQIQEKLLKFATRIPVFMYLTDYREETLKDIITKLEPNLFKRVTGLEIPDFELLVSLGVFNASLMNDAVYKFKRYEDASLIYMDEQLARHKNLTKIGGYDTAIDVTEFQDRY